MRFDDFEKLLPKIKNIPLPAESSHFKMMPPERKDFIETYKHKIKTGKKAGVLALFYPNTEGDTSLILMLRKTYKGVHSAQISFPGGKLESDDKDLKATALRETYEEVGVRLDEAEVIKQLSYVYIPPSNFYVQPFIGVKLETPQFVKEEAEVEQLIEIIVSDLLNGENVLVKKVNASYGIDIEVPTFQLNGFTVWGATAMMLSEIKDILNKLV
ncbi:MAG: NUDIX hydrolase [Jejuia sp.]